MERLRIAITGASGFVGANLVRHFSKDNEVFALSRNVSNWRLPPNINALKIDISDRSSVGKAIAEARPDVVLHCAVYGGYHFEDDPQKTISTNILGALNVIDACKERSTVIINTGSSSEYGIKSAPMKETDSTEPNTNYAMSKALITNLLHSGYTRAITLRLFSVYGYYEEKHRLIPHLLYSAIKGETATLSSKNNVRDFVFIDDVAHAYELAVKKFEKLDNGTVFNVGSGRQTKIAEVVKNLDVKVKWASGTRQKEPPRVWRADISKIKKELGWEPQNSLRQGLEKTETWMRRNIIYYENDENDKLARTKGNRN
ncbi:MAG: NAD(P)-dependent oxidoreductase [Candidatus Micrarchaeota archaeon]|nr:NAD(P)-dependent oxidoreductase [Candidatus Micrarchaeota archaeon]